MVVAIATRRTAGAKDADWGGGLKALGIALLSACSC